MIFAALLFAAIVTEQNNLWTYAPNYAVFEGDSLDPGIASHWIPYGTFTQGIGSSEYLRVTSNLTGVVASAFDGHYERSYVPLQDFDPTGHWSFNSKFILTPIYHGFTNFTDNGEFLASATNNSLRILDRINANDFLTCFSNDNATFSYSVRRTGMIEPNLADEGTFDTNKYHVGVAKDYGSRALDNLVYESGAPLDPPIGSEWSAELPFKVTDLNDWISVWPIYSTLRNDIHFYPPSTNLSCRYYRRHLSSIYAPVKEFGWFYPTHLVDIWGGDVFGDVGTGTGADLEIELNKIPIQFNMEDVLSVSTGWKYEYPPVETGSYWTVSGPLGNFRLGAFYDFSPSFLAWDNWEGPSPTNYYVEISYALYNSYYSLIIYDASTSEQLYYDRVYGDENDDVLYFDSYHAQRTLLFSNQDDYDHWRNMTRRLDWKRLGIICQLERQMEQTYLPRQDEDYIPMFDSSAKVTRNYTAEIEVPILNAEGQPITTTNFNASGASWTSGPYTTEYATNYVGMSYPMARLSPVVHSGKILANMGSSWTIFVRRYELVDLLEGVISDIAAQETPGNGTMILELSGEISPVGTALIWTWEIDFCQFWPDGGGDEIDYQSSASGNESYGVDISSTNSTVVLNMSLLRSAKTRYTLATQSEKDLFLEHLIPYPQTNTWDNGFVAQQTRPTLEVMLDAKGSNIVDILESDDPLRWSYIQSNSNTSHRLFRMSPEVQSAGSQSVSNDRRWQIMQGLNQAVRDNFKSITTFSPDAAATALVQFAPGEEAAIQAQLEAQDMTISADLAIAVTNNLPKPTALVALAISNVKNSIVQSTLLENLFFAADGQISIPIYDSTEDAYELGHLHFVITGANLTNEVTNIEPVRVDAHQDQMIKTLWRFKNLRDPDL